MTPASRRALLDVLEKTWGFDSFRPLQEEAMNAILSERDSVVVLPTGGGKSLCYQAPILSVSGWALVVSPLISLMKDQVDALRAYGVNAAAIHSAATPEERVYARKLVRTQTLKLLYVSPERLMQPKFLNWLEHFPPRYVTIDEAHCISMWGHDFRPEYRQLRELKKRVPNLHLHAYTATATHQVCDDIVEQLGLVQPQLFIGSYDRPNLTYRVHRRDNTLAQVLEVIKRHPKSSGIIYRIRRKDVEELADQLRAKKIRALPYHAGLPEEERAQHQDAFVRGDAEVIVATVAFGMGIDKSDVRYVIHAGLPRSLEHYVQESGRAGRDGLPAECVLLFSDGDSAIWRFIIESAEKNNGGNPETTKIALRQLYAMRDYCYSAICRHRALVQHFGQAYNAEKCDACDICLGELKIQQGNSDATLAILKCVQSLRERFGADHISKVLTGSKDKTVLRFRHQGLTVYNSLPDANRKQVRDWIGQLIALGCLEQASGFNNLVLTPQGKDILLGNEEAPSLIERQTRRPRFFATASQSGSALEQELFDQLRSVRTRLAKVNNVPPYVIFSDKVLRELAATRPTTPETFIDVHGIGTSKAQKFGEVFIEEIQGFCTRYNL